MKLAVKGLGGSEFPTVWERIPASLKPARINFKEVRDNE